MKIIYTIFSSNGEKGIIAGGDDMLLRSGEDFYIPEYAEHLSCVPQIVVRIDRLGKCITPEFAGRYYNEMASGLIFHADSLEERLASKGLPTVQAYTFEGAATLGEFQPYQPTATLSMHLNGELIFEEKLGDMPMLPNECISEASLYHRLKTGDLIYCGNNIRIPLKRGDIVEMKLCYNGNAQSGALGEVQSGASNDAKSSALAEAQSNDASEAHSINSFTCKIL